MAVTDNILERISQNVFKGSSHLPESFQTVVRGHSFTKPNDSGTTVDYHALLQSFMTTGFQATNFGLAVEEINKMVRQVDGILEW